MMPTTGSDEYDRRALQLRGRADPPPVLAPMLVRRESAELGSPTIIVVKATEHLDRPTRSTSGLRFCIVAMARSVGGEAERRRGLRSVGMVP
jgi:hypothetical protein